MILNHDDQAYDKIVFDEFSLQNLENNLHLIDNPLTRSVVWNNIWFHLVDGKISSK